MNELRLERDDVEVGEEEELLERGELYPLASVKRV
jgi:hypothetical protein